MQNRAPLLILLAAVSAEALAAEPHEIVAGLIAQGKADVARARCEKWEVAGSSADRPLREQCALAWWDEVKRLDTVEAWSWYRTAWRGTSREAVAFELEATRALADLGDTASEAQYHAFAERYSPSHPAKEAMQRAAESALKAVRSESEAKAFAKRYPGHAGIADLVQRYLPAFASVAVFEEKATLFVEPDAVLPPGMEPVTSWVSRYPDGTFASWGDGARKRLVMAGLPESWVAARARREDGRPPYPVCWDPNGRPGQAPGVQVVIGRGSMFREVGFSPGCGPDALPAFVTVSRDRVVGLSVAPDHALRFPTDAGAFSWGDALGGGVRLWLPAAPGWPLVAGSSVRQELGEGLWLVHPLDGGPPWWSFGPGTEPSGLPLTADLIGGPLPPGFELVMVGDAGRVIGGELGQGWSLPPGQPRALSPLVGRTAGLDPERAARATAKLPGPTETAWALPPDRPARDAPIPGPAGAGPVVLAELAAAGLAEALAPFAAAGVPISALRGWAVSLDADPAPEVLVEGTVRGVPVRVLVDAGETGADLRAWVFDAEDASILAKKPPTVFGFAREGRTWLAWATATHIEAVTVDAAGLHPQTFRRP